MIVHAPWPRDCCTPPGRRYKDPGIGVHTTVLHRQAHLREQDDEILLAMVLLRAIGMARGERFNFTRGRMSPYVSLAKRIDKRVRLLLSVDWELQRAKELISEHLPDQAGLDPGLSSVGNLPA